MYTIIRILIPYTSLQTKLIKLSIKLKQSQSKLNGSTNTLYNLAKFVFQRKEITLTSEIS